MTAPLLELEDIETCYGLSQVLFGMSLSIAHGEVVTLLGRNGMGKTTTVRSIMGLTPARAGVDPLCRAGRARPAVLSHRQARHRPGAGRPPDLSQSLGARKPGRDRARNGERDGWTLERVLRAVSARLPSAPTTWATSSPAASSRCSRSAAR